MLCEYGCNQEAKFRVGLKNCCSKSNNSCTAQKTKNSEGLKKSYQEGRKKVNNFGDEARLISRQSFVNNLKLKPFELWGKKLREDQILLEQDNKCCQCKTGRNWFGKNLTFELDHIDGDNKNNKRENLRILCPNCHSTTPTWRGRNINSGKQKVSDDELKKALLETKNISEALTRVGLAPKGGNYVRAKKLRELLLT